MSLAVALALAAAAAAPAQGALEARLRVGGSDRLVVDPARPSEWEIEFVDPATGRRAHHFMEMHEKLMHLVVISRDLSTLKHVHPELDHYAEAFRAVMNRPSEDPDNADLADAIARPGVHYVFSDTMPMHEGVHQMRIDRFEVTAEGTEERSPLVPDPPGADGRIVRHFEEGAYRASLLVESLPHCGSWIVRLKLRIEERDASGAYADAQGIEPWLGMGGHAILIGAAGERVEDKTFTHLHAFLPFGKVTELWYPVHNHVGLPVEGLPSDTYRVWFQIKHRGRVLKFPFTIAYERPPLPRMASDRLCR